MSSLAEKSVGTRTFRIGWTLASVPLVTSTGTREPRRIRWVTLPRRFCSCPERPRRPTTMRSAPIFLAVSRMTRAGDPSATTTLSGQTPPLSHMWSSLTLAEILAASICPASSAWTSGQAS